MPTILFSAKSERWDQYAQPLHDALAEAGLGHATLVTEADPAEVDYIVYAPNSGLTDFTPYTRLKAVLNLWAGVEDVVGNETLKVPLARMVGGGLTEGMVEWVTGHVLRYHLGMDAILGLGALGRACGEALSGLGFRVTGWSRTAKDIAGIETFHGADGLRDVLRGAEILVLLLPNTQATENTLNAETLALLPKGAMIVNPGRGPLIDDDALLAALDSGQVGHATLDVFRVEPLPADHPYWAHPKVTVTPHIASETRAGPAARVIVDNIRRGEAGEPFLHLVDRDAGY